VVGGHVIDGPRAEQPHAVELAAPAQHLREPVVVRRRRDEAAAALPALGRVQEQRAHGVVARGPPRRRVGRVQGGEPPGALLLHPEARVAHPERAEDPLGQEGVERLAREHLDQPSQHVGGHAVVPLAAGLEEQRQAGPGVAARGEVAPGRRGPVESGGAIDRVDRMRVVEAVGQAGGVGEQVPDTDGLGQRLRDRLQGGAARPDARVGEGR
jgi:hypothetical protein